MADAWAHRSWTPGRVGGVGHQSALQEYGRSGQVTETILRRDIHLGATPQAARVRKHRRCSTKGIAVLPQEMQESLIVGGPEECIRYLENMQRLGITHVLFRPAMRDQKYVLQTIRLLGTGSFPTSRMPSASTVCCCDSPRAVWERGHRGRPRPQLAEQERARTRGKRA